MTANGIFKVEDGLECLKALASFATAHWGPYGKTEGCSRMALLRVGPQPLSPPTALMCPEGLSMAPCGSSGLGVKEGGRSRHSRDQE